MAQTMVIFSLGCLVPHAKNYGEKLSFSNSLIKAVDFAKPHSSFCRRTKLIVPESTIIEY